MHSSRMRTARSSSCWGVSASVHAGIHRPGPGHPPPARPPNLPRGSGPRHPPARRPNLPLGLGLDTPLVNRITDRQV